MASTGPPPSVAAPAPAAGGHPKSWPPRTLTYRTEELIDECEMMELLPEHGIGKQHFPVVELAALLYNGEYIHARHLWRRWKEMNTSNISNNNKTGTDPSSSSTTTTTTLLVDWWRVGAAMLDECDPVTLWQGLAHIESTHPEPFNAYASEVGTAYRKRVLQRLSLQLAPKSFPPPKQPYWTLLNFSSQDQIEQFCQQHQIGPKYGASTSTVAQPSPLLTNNGLDGKAALTQVVSLLSWNGLPKDNGGNNNDKNSNNNAAAPASAAAGSSSAGR